jgi:transposase-like protein
VPDRRADPTSPYRGHRFPAEVIGHAVWLYFRFHLSFRDAQDLLAERGIIVSHEAIRQWCTKLVRRMPPDYDSVEPGLATNGTWMRCY